MSYIAFAICWWVIGFISTGLFYKIERGSKPFLNIHVIRMIILAFLGPFVTIAFLIALVIGLFDPTLEYRAGWLSRTVGDRK